MIQIHTATKAELQKKKTPSNNALHQYLYYSISLSISHLEFFPSSSFVSHDSIA